MDSIMFHCDWNEDSENHYRSPEILSSFKVISLLPFLLISALLLTEIFLYRPLCIGKLTGFFIGLSELSVHCRQIFTKFLDLLLQTLNRRNTP